MKRFKRMERDLRMKIGYVFKIKHHYGCGYDEVAFSLRVRGLNEEEVRARVMSSWRNVN